MFRLAIVGMGPAGIFTLASLPEDVLSETLVLERSCIGGDLLSQYSTVVSNICKGWYIKTLKAIPKWMDQSFQELDGYKDNELPKIGDVCKMLRRLIMPDIHRANFHKTSLSNIVQTDDGWNLVTPKGAYQAKKVILCLGATPKTIDLPLTSIPLSIALSQEQIARSISPSDTVVVFGISQSGLLVLKNLKNIGCTSVYAIYKGDRSYTTATNEGIGEGLATPGALVSQEINRSWWGPLAPKLISYDDFDRINIVLNKADVVIYAIGFEPRTFTYTHKTGTCHPITNDTPGIYGFGIGRPRIGRTPIGEIFEDIGFEGFVKAIQAELPGILS